MTLPDETSTAHAQTAVPRFCEKSVGPTGSADVSSVPASTGSADVSSAPASAGVGRPSPQGQRVAARPALIPLDTGADETSALPAPTGMGEAPARPGLFTDPACPGARLDSLPRAVV